MVFPDYRCARVEPATTCVSSVITTVWDGGDILLEHRMYSDSGYVSAAAGQFGDVAYVHGLQTDRPLVVMKAGDHDVLPFTNTDDGKFVNGACPDIKCASSDVDFPMGRMPMYGAPPVWVSGAKWYGAPLNGMVDGSGLVYQRNRYLDPRTGLFTQEDPIGLAGGMNLYGFAGGDPVNFSDPFGLCPPEDSKACPWMHEEGLQSGGWADPIAWLSGGIGAGIERGLASVGTKAVASAGARVAANKVAGDAFRDEIASAFESNGYGVAKEVGKRTPFGRRVIDVEVSRNGEVLGGIEAKAGKSRYLPWQMAKDEYLRRAGYPVQLVRDATAVKVSGLP
jgi:RHS repeat-associated protein